MGSDMDVRRGRGGGCEDGSEIEITFSGLEHVRPILGAPSQWVTVDQRSRTGEMGCGWSSLLKTGREASSAGIETQKPKSRPRYAILPSCPTVTCMLPCHVLHSSARTVKLWLWHATYLCSSSTTRDSGVTRRSFHGPQTPSLFRAQPNLTRSMLPHIFNSTFSPGGRSRGSGSGRRRSGTRIACLPYLG